eukprot:jgi/Pico_ML_1/52877/g3518.t1
MKSENVARAILVAKSALTPFAKQCLQEMQPKYIVELFLESELLVNITEHTLVPKHQLLTAFSPSNTRNTMFRKAIAAILIGAAALASPVFGAGHCQTIVEVASGTEELSTLVAAVQAAGLVDALNDSEAEYTVFAPTNDAFDEILVALGLTLEELVADTDLLTNVLLYHVVPVAVESTETEEYPDGSVVPTLLEGESLELNLESGTVVPAYPSPANIIQTDIEACESFVHVIDTVLIPFVPGEAEMADAPAPEYYDE